jgi:hypothetical protein
MKKLGVILSGLALLAMALAIVACSNATPTSSVRGLDTSYPNAVNARSALMLGTVRLEESKGPAITKEQAVKLIPLWQTAKTLVASGTSSQAEQDAVTNQIIAVMTDDQLKAISAMKLTANEMQAFNQSIGVTTSPEGGVPGAGQNLSPQERATRQAQRGGTGGSTSTMDYVIKLLEQKAGK